ncbi:hypothetical protein MFRU_012g02060 [Monilinia fructicola]|nr:hypothetical protein MFRU_012g02060 [Monilinia fructicola]
MGRHTERSASRKRWGTRYMNCRPRRNAISLASGQNVALTSFATTSSCLDARSRSGERAPLNQSLRDTVGEIEVNASGQTLWQGWQGWQASGLSTQSPQLDDQQSTPMTLNSTPQRYKERKKHDDNLKNHIARLRGETGTDVQRSYASRMEGENPIDGTTMRRPANHQTSSHRVIKIPQETSSKPRQAAKIKRAYGSVSIELQPSKLPPRESPPVLISQFEISKSQHVGSTSGAGEIVLSRTEQTLANEETSSLLIPGNPGGTCWTDGPAIGHARPPSYRELSGGNAACVLNEKLENLSVERKVMKMEMRGRIV